MNNIDDLFDRVFYDFVAALKEFRDSSDFTIYVTVDDLFSGDKNG